MRDAEARSVRNAWALSTPALVLLTAAAVGPLLIIVVYSFLVPGKYGNVEWGFSTDAWVGLLFSRDVGRIKIGAVEIGEVRYRLWIKEGPDAVFIDAAHKEVRNPVGQIQIVGTAGLFAGIVAKFEELLNIGMPRLQIDTRRALPFPALVDGAHRAVKRL